MPATQLHARALLALLPIAALAACTTFGSPARHDGGTMLRSESPTPNSPAVSAAAVTERGAIRIALSPAGRELWMARVTVAGATRVDVAGDFSDWDPVALVSRGGGTWGVRLHLRAGVHQIAVRADGGAWVAPAGLATITDEFGGVAGVLVVADSGDAKAERGSPPGEVRQ